MAKIIVELCKNHNGDRNVLQRLIHAAVEAGATHAKGQIIFSDDLVPRGRFEYGEEENNGVVKTIKRPYKNEYVRLKQLDLVEDDYVFFVEECKKAGVVPLVTIFSRNRIPLAASLPWTERIVKIASFDCASFTMIRELLPHFDHFIISTGGAFDQEIEETVKIIKEAGKKLTLLHCVISYPTPLEMCNLKRMDWLRQFTPEVGWSDHSRVDRDGLKASKVALMQGADMIERHFTVQEMDKTKDGPVSLTPSLLKELVQFSKLSKEDQRVIVESEIPEWSVMLGQSTRDMTHTEMLNRDYYRGRFASFVDGEWVNNWEDKEVF